MKIFKNKFILSIISLLIILFGYQVYSLGFYNDKDTNSYVLLLEGKGQLTSGDSKKILSKDDKIILHSGDILRTITPSSLALIEWGDGSITRLGGRSEIIINESFISGDLSEIKVDFELIKGKTWSNVKSVIGAKSYFKETINDRVAAVRGTIFTIDSNNDYIHVVEHKVELSNNSNTKVNLNSGEIFSLSKFEGIDLASFEKDIKDILWEDLNRALDIDYLKNLEDEIKVTFNKTNPILSILEVFSPKYRILYELEQGGNLEKVNELLSRLDEKEKEFIRKDLLYKYQQLNFIKATDDLFETKMIYKDLLTKVSSEDDKRLYISYSLYDLKDSILNNNIESLKKINSYLNENKGDLEFIDFKEIIGELGTGVKIDKDLKNILIKNFDVFGDIFDFKTEDMTVDNVINKAGIIKGDLENKIHEGLDSLFGNFK